MLKLRTSKKTLTTLSRKLVDEHLKKVVVKAKFLRKQFEEYLLKPHSRGLWFPQGFYDDSLWAVMVQEIYYPDINQERLFTIPKIEEDNSYDYSDVEVAIREEKRHLVFLCHGFNGHHEDLKYLRAAIMENDSSAKVYSWLKKK